MQETDVTDHLVHLQQLRSQFADLGTRVKALTVVPGTDGLNQITPLLLQTHTLTAESLARLRALDGSPITMTSGSRYTTAAMASVVSTASRAASDLASALHANAGGANWEPAGDTAAATREHRDNGATTTAGRYIGDAARQLDLSSTACDRVHAALSNTATTATAPPSAAPAHDRSGPTTRADGARQTPPETPATPHKPTAPFSPAQQQALQSIASGDTHLCETVRGRLYVSTRDATRISVGTYNSLARRKLVDRDKGTSLFHGQAITLTERGLAALAELPSPHAAVSDMPAASPSLSTSGPLPAEPVPGGPGASAGYGRGGRAR